MDGNRKGVNMNQKEFNKKYKGVATWTTSTAIDSKPKKISVDEIAKAIKLIYDKKDNKNLDLYLAYQAVNIKHFKSDIYSNLSDQNKKLIDNAIELGAYHSRQKMMILPEMKI